MRDQGLKVRLRVWEDAMSATQERLASSLDEWAKSRGQAPLNLGFLHPSRGHAIVNVYELHVRLSHMLERLTPLAGARYAEAPCRIGDGLWLGGVLAAQSIHTLRANGIRRFINCTPDVQVPEQELEPEALLRIPVVDEADSIGTCRSLG
mmetsp:Transcript_31494/g.102619  ORF Transcript_31494/g.102619 Transcript_31494/m.102619 type:complete len:150 (+) Transcript_31494:31-480(+)